MELVKMTRSHTGTLAELERLCFSRPWSREALEEEIDNPAAVFFAALSEGRVAGYAGMHCPAGDGYLDNVAVFPEFRRQGVASALLKALEEEVRRRGGEFLTLEVRASNGGAIALYTGLGFAEEGRRKDFYTDPREDALILTKRI